MTSDISHTPHSDNGAPRRSASLDRRTILAVIAFVLLVRACLFAWVYAIHPPDQAARETLMEIWTRWDGRHYLEISREGYEGKSLQPDSREFNSRFPPLYSMLVRYSGAVLPLPDYIVGILMSVACLVGSSLVLFALAQFEFGNRRDAWWAIAFLNLHPGSYFAHAVYAESLFVFLSLLYLFDLRVSKNYLRSALSLGALALTRQAGLGFLFLHAYEGLRRLWSGYRQKRSSLRLWSEVAAIGVFPLLCYCAFLFKMHLMGLPGYAGKDVPLKITIPFSETYHALSRFLAWHDAWADRDFLMTLGYSHIAFLLTAITVFAGFFVLPVEYSIAGAGYILMISLMNWNISSIRYMFCLQTTPLVLVALFPSWIRFIIAGAFAGLLGYFTYIFVVYFQLI